jgi:hypothetical protein
MNPIKSWWHRHPGLRMFVHGHVSMFWPIPFWKNHSGVEIQRTQSMREMLIKVLFDEQMSREYPGRGTAPVSEVTKPDDPETSSETAC